MSESSRASAACEVPPGRECSANGALDHSPCLANGPTGMERQDRALLVVRRRPVKSAALAQHESVTDDLGLLFEAVFPEVPARPHGVIVARPRHPPERQGNARLILPNMSHFVDEQALFAQSGVA